MHKPIQPLLISTNDIDGGAARATYRLHRSLQAIDIPSQMLVQNKQSVDSTVIAQKATISKVGAMLNHLPLHPYRDRSRTMFSAQWFPDPVVAKVAQLQPDLVHLHWVCNGYMQIESLAKFNRPLVWTLHDMWPFTGGCHYSQSCDRYTQTCGKCPLLKSQYELDASRWIWQRKAKTYQALNLTVVAPSQWMADCARSSKLFQNIRIEIIPHGLDTNTFKPIEQTVARHLLNLPLNQQLVLFGAGSGAVGDPRKGFHLLQTALQDLRQTGWGDRLELVIFGASQADQPIEFGFKAHYLGRFHDDIALALVYAAADVMIVPSMQEAFGQTASEALACGTPVIAFKSTGVQDIVAHQQDGYLATPFDSSDLAKGIAWVLADAERQKQLRHQARQKAETEFALTLQAERYLNLFHEVLKNS
ncbi:MAG TPA: glycosyltransferase family 4 protein [Allocoleopsis sp.]